jgi:UDP-glucose 4-epimerase
MPSIIGPVKHWRWLYACAKLLDEFWALAYRQQKDLPVIVARFFNVSGPRQTGQWGMVVPTFVQQAIQNKPLTVYGNGKQKRCFMHVDDCIEAIMRLTDNDASIGRSVNIGNSHELSIADLAERVIELVPGTTSTVEYISYEDAYGDGFEDMNQRKPDTSLLAELTGFKPQRPLDDIITDIYEYLTTG